MLVLSLAAGALPKMLELPLLALGVVPKMLVLALAAGALPKMLELPLLAFGAAPKMLVLLLLLLAAAILPPFSAVAKMLVAPLAVSSPALCVSPNLKSPPLGAAADGAGVEPVPNSAVAKAVVELLALVELIALVGGAELADPAPKVKRPPGGAAGPLPVLSKMPPDNNHDRKLRSRF
jgi:hypothetical protein